jgi:hypothetical protein
MSRWRVDYLGAKDTPLGTVEAPDERGAIAEAMKRLAVQRPAGAGILDLSWAARLHYF